MKNLLFVLCLVVAGCGIQRLAEETRDEVRQSNDLQRQMLDNIRKTLAATDELKRSMKTTEEAIHLQILTVAMEQLLSPNNTALLDPPARMMPYAEVFAKEATEDEIIKVSYLLLQDAKNPNGERGQRMTSLVAMSCIAGLTSQEKAQRILEKQIAGKDRFEDTAYSFAMGRYTALRDYLFKPANEGAVNVGALRDVSDYFRWANHLRTSPYASRFIVDIPSLEVNVQIDAEELKAMGKNAKLRFEQGLSQAELDSPKVKEYLKALEL